MKTNPTLIAKSDKEIHLLPAMANRHGLIAGATGTGKTVSLQVMAEGFSQQGIRFSLLILKATFRG